MELSNSGRSMRRATYVVPPARPDAQTADADVFRKANLIRNVAPTPEEIASIAANEASAPPVALLKVARGLSSGDPAESIGLLSTLAGIDVTDIARFATAIGQRRRAIKQHLDVASVPANAETGRTHVHAGTTPAGEASDDAPINIMAAPRDAADGPKHVNVVAVPRDELDYTELYADRFREEADLTSAGWLFLERLEMNPVGIERGELIHTLPMAPGEKLEWSTKEWSITSDELARIVTDEFETYSEQGVSEKHDISMASESETKRDSQVSFGVSASGSYGPVSVSSSYSESASDSDRETRKQTASQSEQLTRKASSRARQQHQVSFRVGTVTGSESAAARTVENNKATPIRIDYFKLLRKWRVDLIRYGLRMTYDLVVPEPGASLRYKPIQLAEVESALHAPFTFDLAVGDITDSSWATLAAQFGAAVEPPPPAVMSPSDLTIQSSDKLSKEDAEQLRYSSWTFEIPPGYLFVPTLLEAHFEAYGPPEDARFDIIGDTSAAASGTEVGGKKITVKILGEEVLGQVVPGINIGEYWSTLPHLSGKVGPISIQYGYRKVSWFGMRLAYSLQRSAEIYLKWQTQVWGKLREAAEQAHYLRTQSLRDLKRALEDEIERDDTLSLRRQEAEEVVKRSLQWLLGPGFDTSPQAVNTALIMGLAPKTKFGHQVDASSLNTSLEAWSAVRRYGEFIKFIHQAIEWENVLHFIYPYFWGSASYARDRQALWHPDATRREFIRAGAARVVLPVRPGFERRFAQFLETGSVAPSESAAFSSSAYMTIADEIRAHARTNYPGIPPANPDVAAQTRPLLSADQDRAWDDIQRLVRALEQAAEKSKQLNEPSWHGAPSEPDYYPREQDWRAAVKAVDPTAHFTDPWGVEYQYERPGVFAPFRVRTLGQGHKTGGVGAEVDISTDAEGNLVGSWFEYTPTAGVDIAVDTSLGSVG